jgi:hypothetical protein
MASAWFLSGFRQKHHLVLVFTNHFLSANLNRAIGRSAPPKPNASAAAREDGKKSLIPSFYYGVISRGLTN